jgi:hypothetical protein
MIKSGAAIPHRYISSKYIFVFAGPAVLYFRPEQNIVYMGTQHRTCSSVEAANILRKCLDISNV